MARRAGNRISSDASVTPSTRTGDTAPEHIVIVHCESPNTLSHVLIFKPGGARASAPPTRAITHRTQHTLTHALPWHDDDGHASGASLTKHTLSAAMRHAALPDRWTRARGTRGNRTAEITRDDDHQSHLVRCVRYTLDPHRRHRARTHCYCSLRVS